MAKKWIQKAIEHPGAFKKWCQSNGFDGVCQACINKAAKAGGHPAKMASLAATLSKGKYKYPSKESVTSAMKE